MAGADPSLVVEGVKAVLTFVGGVLTVVISQRAARRGAQVQERTATLDYAIRPLESAVASWEKLLEPMSTRIDDLQSEVQELREEQKEREGLMVQSMTLLMLWGQWIDAGANPPPPVIPSWLRAHMVAALRELDTP